MVLAETGEVPLGSFRNREHYLPKVGNREQLSPKTLNILADPQASGSLQISIPAERL
jgi:selenide,water dikinase